ncbi:MAG: DUF1015 domain-containing protein [Deltaproteobacteria bacterium]|nr:DUF1015 domain-containing protein [Deltaproteobacteria bacterium]
MPRVEPFRALRPLPEHAARVASVPYDVVSTAEARALASGNDLSFLHVVRSEIDLPPSVPADDPRVYGKAFANLARFEAAGVLVREPEPVMYVYRLETGGHVQTGVVGAVSVEDRECGAIREHELTRKDKEDDRLRHIETCRAYAEPVYLMHRPAPAVSSTVAEVTNEAPLFDFGADNGVRHTLWGIAGKEKLDRFVAAFAALPALYVADGHHRTAAAVRHAEAGRAGRTGEWRGGREFFPAVIFPENELRVLGYHRVVMDLNGHTPRALLDEIRGRFDVVTPGVPEQAARGVIGMFVDGCWHLLRPAAGTFDAADPLASVDISILQQNLLAPLLGIEDLRTDPRIDFVSGARGPREIERRCREDAKVGFFVAPVTAAQVMAVSDAGGIMPPKSTWFDPKPRSGLFVKTLDE